jgi:hypothetical protein
MTDQLNETFPPAGATSRGSTLFQPQATSSGDFIVVLLDEGTMFFFVDGENCGAKILLPGRTSIRL